MTYSVANDMINSVGNFDGISVPYVSLRTVAFGGLPEERLALLPLEER